MALPVTISGVDFPVQNYFCGPIKANGSFYTVLVDSATAGNVVVHKADDPTASFSEQDAAGAPTITVDPRSLWAYLEGDEIHIATVRPDGNNPEAQYHVFDTSTDSWTTIAESIENLKSIPAADNGVSTVLRSDGDVIVLHQGTPDSDMATDYQRVDYSRREGGSWTTGIDVGGTSPAAEHRIVGVAIRGSGDNVHFFWGHIVSDTEPRGRSLDSSNSLSTIRTSTTVINNASHQFLPGVSYDDSGTQRVTALFRRDPSSNPTLIAWRFTESSGQLSTPVAETTIDDSTTNPVRVQTSPIACSALNTIDNQMYVLWARNSDADLYSDNAAPPQSTWGTDVEVLNSVTVNRISCNIYQRGSNIKLAYIYDDAFTVKYNEVDLGAAPAGGVLAPTHRKYERHNLLR